MFGVDHKQKTFPETAWERQHGSANLYRSNVGMYNPLITTMHTKTEMKAVCLNYIPYVVAV